MKKDSVKQSDILYFLENIYPCNEWIIIFTVEIFYFNYSLKKISFTYFTPTFL